MMLQTTAGQTVRNSRQDRNSTVLPSALKKGKNTEGAVTKDPGDQENLSTRIARGDPEVLEDLEDRAGPEVRADPEARQARAEGIVLVEMVVQKDGTLQDLRLLKGLGYGLDESAINTISKRWRFAPGTFQNKPVDVKCKIEVSFRLY